MTVQPTTLQLVLLGILIAFTLIGWAVGRFMHGPAIAKEIAEASERARKEGYQDAVNDYRKLDPKRRATLRVPLPKLIKKGPQWKTAKKTKKRRR